jgi:hypothetical protein
VLYHAGVFLGQYSGSKIVSKGGIEGKRWHDCKASGMYCDADSAAAISDREGDTEVFWQKF